MSKALIPKNVSSTGADDVNLHRDSLMVDIERARLDQAFKHRYRVTDRQAETLQKYFDPIYIHEDPTAILRVSSHPILAIINDYCNHDANEQAVRLRNKGQTVMTIGDSTRNKIKSDHNCILLADSREAFRVVSTQSSPTNITDIGYLTAAVQGGSSSLCTRGAQKCNFIASHCFAVHSMYDVSLDTLYDIFAQHDIIKMVNYMYMPTSFYHNATVNIDNELFTIRELKNNKILFNMHDSSIPYVHDKDLWKRWGHFTSITGPDFRIVREISRTIGPLQISCLTRISRNYLGEIWMTIPLRTLCAKYVYVPNLVQYVESGRCLRQEELHHFPVPVHVIDGLNTYINRVADEGYRFVEVATLASGLKRQLKIGNVVYYDHWEVSAIDYHRILISVFVIGAMKRAERTKNISSLFAELKGAGGFFSDLFGEVTWCFRRLCHFLDSGFEFPDDYQPEADFDGRARRLRDFDYLYVGDRNVQYDHQVTTTVSANNSVVTSSLVNAMQNVMNNLPPETDNDTLQPPQQPFMLANLRRSAPRIRVNLSDGISATSAIPSVMNNLYPRFSNSSIDNAIRLNHIPTSFMVGHCAMESCYNAYYNRVGFQNSKITIKNFITRIHTQLSNYVRATGGIALSQRDVDLYIYGAVWRNSNASGLAIAAFAESYSTTVLIHDSGVITIVNPSTPSIDQIDVYYANDHYTAIPSGGAADKFPDLLRFIAELPFYEARVEEKPQAIVEISAAPGKLIKLCKEEYSNIPNLHTIALIYKPGLKADADLTQLGIIVHEYSNKQQLRDLLCRLWDQYQISMIINDAASHTNTEAITDYTTEVVREVLMNHPTAAQTIMGDVYPLNYIVKTFGNPRKVWELSANFSGLDTYKPPSTNGEVYYGLTGFNINMRRIRCDDYDEYEKLVQIDYDDCYKEYSKSETQHTFRFNAAKLLKFSTEYFAEFAKYKPTGLINKIGNVDRTITFSAITGYASSSKTTRAVAKYPNAIYVAPTQELRNYHSVKFGVASYTQHCVFSAKNPKHIIVDEMSQFYAEYIALLSVTFPDAKLTILGDVHQIPPTMQTKTRYTTFQDIGVSNNIRETYKIPQDVASMLNKRLGFDIIAKSEVEEGFIQAPDISIDKIPNGGFDLKFICMNAATVDELKKKKNINASTITTYTGSRQHTVVFYVDSRAIQSSLLAKTEFIYTAMTRATDQIVTYGNDADAIRKFFHIDGRNVKTFEEINQVRLHHDVRIETVELDNERPVISQLSEPVITTPVSQPIAETTLIKEYMAANATDVFTNVSPNSIAPVEHGVLSVNANLLTTPLKTKPVYKLSDLSLVKNQISNMPLQTIQTITKRYAQKRKTIDFRKFKILETDIITGFSKAVTGRPDKINYIKNHLFHNRHKLQKHYEEFLISVQTKMTANKAYADAFDDEFRDFNELLTFFNKQQSKFKGEDGFDTSDKVGQGISNISKKLNILFSVYARYILTEIRLLMSKDNRKVIVNTHESESELNDVYNAMMNDLEDIENHMWACADVTEWDTKFRIFFLSLMKILNLASGCPEWLYDFYIKYRSHWKMRYNTKDGVAVLSGEEEQFSGGPFTILCNSFGNMALIHSVFDFKGAVLQLWKGDDSAVLCESVEYSVKGKDILKTTGHVIKDHVYRVGEFAGFTLNKHGIFPDVVRYTAKFLGKEYRDEEHFIEAKKSIAERISMVKTNQQKIEGCLGLTEHYKHLTADDMSLLFDFLANANKIPFGALKVENKSVYIPDKEWD